MIRTKLWNIHKNLGAKFINYEGWEMPIQYKPGIIKEHNNVRENVGLFDVSHMGFITLSGRSLFPFLNRLTTNNISDKPYRATYTVLPNERGGCIDDVLVYHLDNNQGFIVPNCANTEKVLEHFKFHGEHDDLEITKHTNKTILALQGPKSKDLLSEIFDFSKLLKNRIMTQKFNGTDILVSNTGYTGEKGFEIFIDNDQGENLWGVISEVGEKYNLMPIGLGARDTLRLEKGFALYGNELDEETTPTETVSKWCVKNENCLGYNNFKTDKKQIGIILDRGMLHKDYPLYNNPNKERQIGKVVSGGFSPALKKSIGIASIDSNFNNKSMFVDIRGKLAECNIKKMPFV